MNAYECCATCGRRGSNFCDECHPIYFRPMRCPYCNGELSGIRTNGPEPVRHCLACNFDFPVDREGDLIRREVNRDGDR